MIQSLKDLKQITVDDLMNMSTKELQKSLTVAVRTTNRKVKDALEGFNAIERGVITRELGLGERTKLTRYQGADRDLLINNIMKAKDIATKQTAEGKPLASRVNIKKLIKNYEEILEHSSGNVSNLAELYDLINSTPKWVDQAVAMGLSSGEAAEKIATSFPEASQRAEFTDWVVSQLQQRYNEERNM